VSRWTGIAVAGLLAAACDSERPVASPVALRLAPAAPDVLGPDVPHRVPAFDVVATDADADGDVDALVNWHHHGPFELLENRGGRFASSYDLGIEPDVYAESPAMQERIRARGGSGLYLWHDLDRGGRWRFLWYDPQGRHRGLALALETSIGFLLHEGLSDDEVDPAAVAPAGSGTEPAGEARLEIHLGPDVRERAFSVQTRRIGVRLAVHRLSVGGAEPAALFLGPELRPVGGDLELWKGDPHGVAWLDVLGRGAVDLFVSRGALGGKLVAPRVAKRDRWLRRVDAQPLRYEEVADAVPPDRGRARRVEAVDVDADGRLELWVGSRATPNRLLAYDPTSGRFADRAAALGLDTRGGAVASFADVDGDGRDDLLFVEDGRLDLLRNATRAGSPDVRFERVSGASLGLVLPSVEEGPGVIDPAQLRAVDLDRDGDLDLLLLAYGRALETRVFLREGERFRDATRDWGVADTPTGAAAALVDLDLDGLPDLVQLGEAPAIWHNRRTRFAVLPLPPRSVPHLVSAVAVLDADADGDDDLLLVGRTRRLLWNRSEHPNGPLRVGLPARAIGATVTAEYADGSAQVQRFGSASSTAFSQALQPLCFGSPAAAPIEQLRVRWPGRSEAERFAVDGRQRIDLQP
jgi:hypothetical protein